MPTESVIANHGYNIASEYVNLYTRYADLQEQNLNNLIGKLHATNLQIKIISDVMNKLAHAKQADKKFDPANDELAMKYLYLIHMRNPSILEGKIHNLPVEEMGLEAKLNAIIDEMRQEGIVNADLDAILERCEFDGNIRFDLLNEGEIDVVVQGLDAELKMLNADLNEGLMNINSKYEDRSQMTESARQTLKEADELNKSIIQKTGRGG